MDANTKIYRGNKYYNLGLLVIPLLLGVVFLSGDNPMTLEKWIGLSILSSMAIILALIPFGARLEIGSNYVRTYFLSIRITHIQAKDVQAIQYGKLFRGGLGFGNGLNIRAIINGRSKATSFGERLYGKEAIAHAKRVLEVKCNNGDMQ